MRFKVKTEKELAKTFDEGTYDFEVVSATDTVSKKSGNEMIALTLTVYVGERTYTCFDYLLGAMEYKLRHFCDAVGILDKYEQGTLTAADCRGKAGKAKFIVQPGEGSFPDKNAVKDYVKRSAYDQPVVVKPEAAAEPKRLSLADDDIPF